MDLLEHRIQNDAASNKIICLLQIKLKSTYWVDSLCFELSCYCCTCIISSIAIYQLLKTLIIKLTNVYSSWYMFQTYKNKEM